MIDETERRWADLMRASLRGDGAAYARLLAELTPLLRAELARRAARTSRAANETEDIVQETLIAIHLKRHTWDDTRPLLPWVRAIARFKQIDAARRRVRRHEVPIDDLVDTLPGPEPEPELGFAVERYLNALPVRQRQVVEALAVNGASVREAASRFDMTENAVRVSLHRGLQRLLETFGKR